MRKSITKIKSHKVAKTHPFYKNKFKDSFDPYAELRSTIMQLALLFLLMLGAVAITFFTALITKEWF